MKKIVNSIIPFEGFVAITVWPFVFVRRDEEAKFDKVAGNHESIHGEQQIEMGIVGLFLTLAAFLITCSLWSMLLIPVYFWWYLIEWLLRSVFGTGNAYRNISFEREAYANEKDLDYIHQRDMFAWIGYMKRR